MEKINLILRNTFLALATGLFTGGVITTIISDEHSLGVLTHAYLPAVLFYEFYILLNVIESEKDAKKNLTLIIINVIMILSLFFYYLIGCG